MKHGSVVIACEVKTGEATPRRVYFLGETPAEVAALEHLWQALLGRQGGSGSDPSTETTDQEAARRPG